MQERRNSIANALELRLNTAKQSTGRQWVKFIGLDHIIRISHNPSGPLFTKRTDVLPEDLAKSRTREIRVETFPITLKFDRHLGSGAAEMAVKFQSDTIIITPNLAASWLREIWR